MYSSSYINEMYLLYYIMVGCLNTLVSTPMSVVLNHFWPFKSGNVA